MASSVTDAESLHLRCAEVLWDCLDGLCLHEREAHPTLGKPEELLALMLKKRCAGAPSTLQQSSHSMSACSATPCPSVLMARIRVADAPWRRSRNGRVLEDV